MLDGMAKPMPSLPPDSLLICVLTPTTWAAVFRSGPPELPWLMAASVWIEFEIVKLFWEVISLFRALTMPLVAVPSSPKGLPSATTPSPTLSWVESPSLSGVRIEAGASTSMTARSVDGSVPTTVASYVEPSQKRTETSSAPSTTWSFVTM